MTLHYKPLSLLWQNCRPVFIRIKPVFPVWLIWWDIQLRKEKYSFFPGQDCFGHNCREFINGDDSEFFSSKERWDGRSPAGVLPCLAMIATPHSSPFPAHLPQPRASHLFLQQRCSVFIARKHSGSFGVCPAVSALQGHGGIWGSVLRQFHCLLL